MLFVLHVPKSPGDPPLLPSPDPPRPEHVPDIAVFEPSPSQTPPHEGPPSHLPPQSRTRTQPTLPVVNAAHGPPHPLNGDPAITADKASQNSKSTGAGGPGAGGNGTGTGSAAGDGSDVSHSPHHFARAHTEPVPPPSHTALLPHSASVTTPGIPQPAIETPVDEKAAAARISPEVIKSLSKNESQPEEHAVKLPVKYDPAQDQRSVKSVAELKGSDDSRLSTGAGIAEKDASSVTRDQVQQPPPPPPPQHGQDQVAQPTTHHPLQRPSHITQVHPQPPQRQPKVNGDLQGLGVGLMEKPVARLQHPHLVPLSPSPVESLKSPTLLQQVQSILAAHSITDVVWLEGATMYQATFPCLYSQPEILKALMDVGIGAGYGSISVVPVEIARPSKHDIQLQWEADNETTGLHDTFEDPLESSSPHNGSRRHSAWKLPRSMFTRARKKSKKGKQARTPKQLLFDTVQSTLAIERILDSTKLQAKLSFDYIVLCVMASFISTVGLMQNNTVVIVASMLISPLMGPIMGFTFGLVIHDYALFRTGVWSELVGLTLTVLTGFTVGMFGSHWGPSLGWPTEEMIARGTIEAALVGIAIAVPSGVGVALSVLSNNVSSLVGVAISASLLPPAANMGLSWSYALVGPLWHNASDGRPFNSTRFIVIGANSLLLTVLNIICIFIVGVLMFKLKEVAPIPGKQEFWKKHLPQAREVMDTIHGHKAEQLGAALSKLGPEDFRDLERMLQEDPNLMNLNYSRQGGVLGGIGPVHGLGGLGNMGMKANAHTFTGSPGGLDLEQSTAAQLLSRLIPLQDRHPMTSSPVGMGAPRPTNHLEDLFLRPPAPSNASTPGSPRVGIRRKYSNRSLPQREKSISSLEDHRGRERKSMTPTSESTSSSISYEV